MALNVLDGYSEGMARLGLPGKERWTEMVDSAAETCQLPTPATDTCARSLRPTPAPGACDRAMFSVGMNAFAATGNGSCYS